MNSVMIAIAMIMHVVVIAKGLSAAYERAKTQGSGARGAGNFGVVGGGVCGCDRSDGVADGAFFLKVLFGERKAPRCGVFYD